MTQKYLKNKRIISGRAIARILAEHKKVFIRFLEAREKKGAFWNIKEDIVEQFIDETKKDIPEYLSAAIPAVMVQGAKENIEKWKTLLPSGYSLAFDLPTSPASNYVRALIDLHLSDYQGSILKTTRDELRTIIANGLDDKLSYGDIAKRISETDPFVFSKSRGKLIAVNEIWRAYGWADHEPSRVLATDYDMEKKWNTSADEKVRPTHALNGSQGWIPFEKTWAGTGDEYAPSHDINCRCTGTDRIIGIKKTASIEQKNKYLALTQKAI